MFLIINHPLYGTVQHLRNLEICLPNLEMAMGASSCAARVASSTLGAIWVGCEGPHWPTQCSIVAENAFFQCVCGTFHIWKCSCQIWKWPWGLQCVGPWPPWWPLAHLGPFGWLPQDAKGPQSVTQAINVPFFCHGQIAVFCPKK